MYNLKEVKQTIFINIQTVSEYKSLKLLYNKKPKMYELWNKKMLMKYLKDRSKTMTDEELIKESIEYYSNKSWTFPEYGKIIGVSIGIVTYNKDYTQHKINIKNIIKNNEEDIIKEFYGILDEFKKNRDKIFLSGFNLKGNIIPYFCKRSVINNIPIHKMFDLKDVKPWESPFIDTMEMWRFGDFNFTPFEIMCGAIKVDCNMEYMDYGLFSSDYHAGKIDDNHLAKIMEENNIANINAFLKLNK
ncbi:MAG: hypothetical protein ACOC33_00480 [bacterium]